MSVIQNNLLLTGEDSYNLTRSLRFRSSASAYLNRTPASAGNRKTWTWSAWVKLGTLGTLRPLFYNSNGAASNGHGGIYLETDNTLWFQGTNDGASYSNAINTNAVLRDPSACYHLVVVCDTTNATQANRQLIYINGVLQSCTVTQAVTLNTDLQINRNTRTDIGTNGYTGSTNYFDGYLTEVNFIDGQALTPSSFGSNNASTGVWQPKKYAGTYGTNGFYLPFTNNSTTTTLGNDFSGNGNNWTTNNISLTAGVTYDSMTDVPTLTSATASNFCTLNPLSSSSYVTISGGNLNTSGNTSADEGVCGSTFMVKTGKWYTEFTVTGSIVSNRPNYGIIPNPNANFANGGGQFANTGGMRYGPDGKVYTSGSLFGTFSTFTTGDVIGIAIDADNGAAYVSKNGTFQNSGVPTSGASKTGAVVTWTGGTVDYFVCVDEYNGTTSATNFGQRPFAYTPPTGFVALNTFNLPTPTIGATASTQANKYMDISLYTGNSSTQAITNSGGFAPDFIWVKGRSTSARNRLFNILSGVQKELYSDLTNAEASDANSIQSFNSNGFTLGSNDANTSGTSYVGWQWKANGTGVTNTAGSITSTVSANTTSGFSVVTYTGNGSSGTVGHGLGVAPSMIIVKSRSAVQRWTVFHASISNAYIYLNETLAADTGNAQLRFGNNSVVVQPTSTSFSIGNSVDVNQNTTTYVAYCFSEIAGYSKFSSYTGNGSADGTFVYCGFKPRYIMIKRTDSAQNWPIVDTARDTYNVANKRLFANLSDAEDTGIANYLDILSNGFKCRDSNVSYNASGGTYIVMAFAENPFKYSLAR